MKVKIRTLKQEKYEVEIDAAETVSKLKDIIEERFNFPKAWQILIFSGKILADDKSIDSYKIEDKDFLVLMVKKPAEAASSQTAPATEKPATTQQPEKKEVTQEKPESSSTSAVTSAPAATGSAPVAAPAPASTTSEDPEYLATVTRICELGFPKDQVEAALRAAFGVADRAVDYLFNGIPDGVAAMAAAQAQPAQPAQPTQPRAAAPPSPQRAAPGGGSGVFDALRNHPQFPALCHLAQTGGEDALKQILTHFAQTNPQLIQLIGQHQEEFIQLLNTPLPQGQAPGALGGLGAGGPQPIRVRVTPEDEQIINNLVGMGFEKNRVMEAYFLFEKDYTMTANYLLNNGQEEDFDMGDDTGGAYGDGDGDDDEDELH